MYCVNGQFELSNKTYVTGSDTERDTVQLAHAALCFVLMCVCFNSICRLTPTFLPMVEKQNGQRSQSPFNINVGPAYFEVVSKTVCKL